MNAVVAAAQIAPRLGDVGANLEIHAATVREARKRGVDLLVFPELSLTGYQLFDMVPSVACRLDGPEFVHLRELARGIAIVVGFVEETSAFRFFNSAAFLDSGEVVAVHRKVYLPTYGMFEELRYLGRGSAVRAFDTRFGRVAMLICEDLWHTSAVYLATLDGASLLLCQSASPLRGISDDHPQDDTARAWELINWFNASRFELNLVYANRVGFEDGVGFWGGSEIRDRRGALRAKGRYYEPDLIAAELALSVENRTPASVDDNDLAITLAELCRIRGRPLAPGNVGAPSSGRNSQRKNKRRR